MKLLTVKAGDKLTFKGCAWAEHWGFDNPGVIYTPVCVYNPNLGSVSEEAVWGMIEDACCDLAAGLEYPTEWTKSDSNEFSWRGWSPDGFKKRKRAKHYSVCVEFKLDADGELTWEYLEGKAI